MEQDRMMGIIVVAAALTFLLRALPFLVFGKKRHMPEDGVFGKVLPSAIMAILIVYCMRNSPLISNYLLREFDVRATEYCERKCPVYAIC